MRVRRITISMEAYEALLRVKRPGESLSDVILRLIENGGTILDLAGAWRELDGEEVEKVFRDIRMKWSWRET